MPAPRLRFDRVATRLIERLERNLDAAVPKGMALFVTVTAPIRLAAKTTAALEEIVPPALAGGSLRTDKRTTINGNRIRIRLLQRQSPRAPRVIVFVHNPGVDHRALLAMAAELV